MGQKPLFYDDWKQSCRTLIQDSGHKFNAVAHHLRPDLKLESAYAWLKACLADDGDQKIDFGQVIELMRFCGQFDALYFACDELNHDRPPARAPEDEMAMLQRQFIAAAGDMKKLAERIDRAQLRSVG